MIKRKMDGVVAVVVIRLLSLCIKNLSMLSTHNQGCMSAFRLVHSLTIAYLNVLNDN